MGLKSLFFNLLCKRSKEKIESPKNTTSETTSSKNTQISAKWNVHLTKLSTPRDGLSATAIDGDRIIIIGGRTINGNMKNGKIIELFETKKKRENNAITKLPNMEQVRWGHSSVILNNCIYIIGGYDDFSYLSSVHCFDVSPIIDTLSTSSSSLNHWETNVIPNMDIGRAFAAAVVYDEYIYVFGGESIHQGRDDFGDYNVLSSGVRYKPRSSLELSDSSSFSDQYWEPISPMKQKRHSFAAVKNGDRIYIIGGSAGVCYYTDSMEIYDPYSNTFQDGPTLPVALSGMTAVSIKNYIVVTGGGSMNDIEGYRNNTVTFLFDTNNQKWKTIHSPSINEVRSNHAMALLRNNNEIFICGGYDSTTRELFDTIEYIAFDEVLYGKRWERRKEYILIRSLLERERASLSTRIILRKEKKSAKIIMKKGEYECSSLQHLVQESDDDVFRMVLRFL